MISTSSWSFINMEPDFKFEHVCSIGSFSKMMEMKPNKLLLSSPFSFKIGDMKLEWRLKICPNGDGYNEKNRVDVYLQEITSATGINMTVGVTLSIVNKDGSKKGSKTAVEDGVRNWTCSRIINHSDVKNVLSDDTLSIMVEINITRIVTGSMRKPVVKAIVPSKEEATFSKYMKNVFVSSRFTDVTILCGEKEFNCHKAILAERSSVFESMFTIEMKEAMENEVTIKDMDAETCQQMLLYIYSSKVEAIDKEGNAESLLAAAEKYDLKGLKTLTENHLSANLNIDNVMSLLVLADLHCASTLRSLALQFVADNRKQIVAKKEWRGKLTKYPELMEEIIDIIAQS